MVAPFFVATEVNRMVKINGAMVEAEGVSVKRYLLENGYDLKRIAVELNGDILTKSKYENTYLNDGDSIEIVSFVGGG